MDGISYDDAYMMIVEGLNRNGMPEDIRRRKTELAEDFSLLAGLGDYDTLASLERDYGTEEFRNIAFIYHRVTQDENLRPFLPDFARK